LLCNGSLGASASNVTVLSGATLCGTGTIGHAVFINTGGTLGVSNGVLTIGSNLTLQAGGILAVDLGSGTTSYGQLVVQGAVHLNGSTLKVTTSHMPADGFPYLILNKTVSGPIPDLFSAQTVTVTYQGGTTR